MKIIDVKVFCDLAFMVSVDYHHDFDEVHIDEFIISDFGEKFLLECGSIEV